MGHPFETYVHVPGIVGIKTNFPGFRWGFGVCGSPAPEAAYEACRLKVLLDVRRDREVFSEADPAAFTGVFRDFKAIPQGKAVLFEKKIGPVPLRFLVSVEGGRVRAVVGRSYLRLIKLKLMYIHPIAYVLFDLVSLLLLRQGMTTLYGAAALLREGGAVFCAAAPNTGKSLTVLQLQNKYGAGILAEDMAVTDGERLWGAPYTGLYRNYHDKSLRGTGEKPETELPPQRIDAVFLLQKGARDRVLEPEPEDLLHQLLLINRYSLGYYYSPCLRVLDYYNRELDVQAAQEAEARILGELAGKARRMLVERRNSLEFAPAIQASMAEEPPRGVT